jgi:hypothetical protein
MEDMFGVIDQGWDDQVYQVELSVDMVNDISQAFQIKIMRSNSTIYHLISNYVDQLKPA